MKYRTQVYNEEEIQLLSARESELVDLIVKGRVLTDEGFNDEVLRAEISRVVSSFGYHEGRRPLAILCMSAFILRGANATLIITPNSFYGPLALEYEGYFVPNEMFDSGYAFPEVGSWHYVEGYPDIKCPFTGTILKGDCDKYTGECARVDGYEYDTVLRRMQSMYFTVTHEAPDMRPHVSVKALAFRTKAVTALKLELAKKYPLISADRAEFERVVAQNAEIKRVLAKARRAAKKASQVKP